MTDYKDTLNLPRTGFAMRAELAKQEPLWVQRWQDQDLYGAIQRARSKKDLFVLHDGPPYANGQLHHGSMLNKILKDMVIKDRTMAGYRAAYVPGWDCHGLPIEVHVEQTLQADLSKEQMHQACRAYAQRFVDIQRATFKRLGILGRWDAPYLTMSYAYEAATLRELARLVRNGLVYKGLRPIHWCPRHQTALAEAEVEYETHRSPSVYVAFSVIGWPQTWQGPKKMDLVVWTTTPWTLPANLAIAVHPDLEYIAYPVKGRLCVVARGLVDCFLKAVGEPPLDPSRICGIWKGKGKGNGKALEGLRYQHPVLERCGSVVLASHVTLDAGTGCVHIAPGHGSDDFEVGRRYQLEVLSPVDHRGCLTQEAGPFAGYNVRDANPVIIQALQACGALLNNPDDTLEHRYAHCWRCHKPLIVRATEQWFVAMDQPFLQGPSLRQRALKALDDIRWIPAWGENRLRGMLTTRPDWCLSRQRTWGVPIAVLYCTQCHTPVLSPDHMDRVADIFAQEGASAWFVRSVLELYGPLKCSHCGHTDFRKETDILDVWFDSGVSYAAVLEREGLGHQEGPLADLYLEGSDQHRGWFHTSLLCALATRQVPPYRSILTHGFVVDGQGKKISKSKGNFIDPFVTIDNDGAELLRLWVASVDYRDDVRISPEILTRLKDTYRKIRNTLRYLLGNLYDFIPNQHGVRSDHLPSLDQYALALLDQAAQRMQEAYQSYSFHTVVQVLTELCTVDVSAFYLDIIKDRLYASAVNSPQRRAAQTVLYVLARDIIRWMAPIFCFTAEEAWGCLPAWPGDASSVHEMLYPWENEPEELKKLHEAVAVQHGRLLKAYASVREVRRHVNAALETARQQKRLGSSVEASVTVGASGALYKELQQWGEDELADLFIVSKVILKDLFHFDAEPLNIEVGLAPGTKCARCWLYRPEVGQWDVHPDLCKRCVEAL